MYKIMIIEDDSAIISELEKLIRSWGMDAVHVTDFDAVSPNMPAIPLT